MRLLWLLFLVPVYGAISWNGCHFLPRFYRTRPTIFDLDHNHTVLTVRALYPLSNHSTSSTLSTGMIHRLADTLLVPVPLLVQCPQSARLYSPIDCELTLIDTRVSMMADHLFVAAHTIDMRGQLCSKQWTIRPLSTFRVSVYIRRPKSDLEK